MCKENENKYLGQSHQPFTCSVNILASFSWLTNRMRIASLRRVRSLTLWDTESRLVNLFDSRIYCVIDSSRVLYLFCYFLSVDDKQLEVVRSFQNWIDRFKFILFLPFIALLLVSVDFLHSNKCIEDIYFDRKFDETFTGVAKLSVSGWFGTLLEAMYTAITATYSFKLCVLSMNINFPVDT